MVAPYVPISDVRPWTQSIAGLNQFVYSTNWTANDASDILVYSRAPNIPVSDVIQLVDASNYTVEFIGSENVVQVTFLPSHNPPQYNIVTIMRNQPSEFLNLYTNTNFTPSMLNSDFDNLVQVDQQNQLYWQQIVPRYNNSATVNVPIDTILPVLRAGEFWIKNSTNTAFIAATLGEGGTFPVLGPFILYTTDSNFPEGFSLGTLADGLLAQTSTAGIATPYTLPFPIDVAHGGTGQSSITPYAVLVGNSVGTSPITTVSNLGNVGYVFTSSGAGAEPSWQPLPPEVGSPIGTIIDYAGTDLPDSYLACDGTAVSRTTYSSLFSVIGTIWGVGNGTTTFNLPNLNRRVTMGSGGSGSAIIGNAVGNTSSNETTALSGPNLPANTALCNGSFSTQSVLSGASTNVPGGANGWTTGNATPFNIVQPSAIVRKLIKFQ